jgi:hypothetical protein
MFADFYATESDLSLPQVLLLPRMSPSSATHHDPEAAKLGRYGQDFTVTTRNSTKHAAAIVFWPRIGGQTNYSSVLDLDTATCLGWSGWRLGGFYKLGSGESRFSRNMGSNFKRDK